MKKVALILAGCGALDGSEIHESIMAMIAIERAGATYECLSVDEVQVTVADHFSGSDAAGERRNMMIESARIARGEVRNIQGAKAEQYSAAIIPGGFGPVNNISTYVTDGVNMSVHPEIARFLGEMHDTGKPIGAIATASILLAKLLGADTLLTIGNDSETAHNIRFMGARHAKCDADEICVDDVRRVVSLPGYMASENASKVAAGVDKLVTAVLEFT